MMGLGGGATDSGGSRMKPRCLDLFSGAGGMAKGLQAAGFYVVGVDTKPMKRYCGDAFVQMDAIEALKTLLAGGCIYDTESRAWYLRDFAAVHSSPPCQAHSAMKTMPNAKQHVSLIAPTRELLIATGLPYVIENVEGAKNHMIDPVMLCGTMFGLRTECGAELRRHRLFECPWWFGLIPSCNHSGRTVPVDGHSGGHSNRARRPRTITVCGDGGGWAKLREGRADGIDGRMFPLCDRKQAMGIEWMTGAELSQAIPPVYGEYIGRFLIQVKDRGCLPQCHSRPFLGA